MTAGALRLIRIAGTAVLVLFVLGTVFGPTAPVVRNPPGFTNPVVGIELARTPDEVFGIVGAPGTPGREAGVRKMIVATRLDALFLVAYAVFYLGIGRLLVARTAPRPLVRAALVALPLAAAFFDAFENREVVFLAAATDPAAMPPALARLRAFTTIKWASLYAVSALVGHFVWRQTGWWRWSGLFFLLAAVVGAAGVVHPPAVEWSLLPLGIAWTMTWVYALRARA